MCDSSVNNLGDAGTQDNAEVVARLRMDIGVLLEENTRLKEAEKKARVLKQAEDHKNKASVSCAILGVDWQCSFSQQA